MGFNGKPGPGRPKGSRNGSSIAKAWAEQDGGWELIIRMIKGTEPNFMRSPGVRADLAKFMIERAYGKASQSVELSGPGGGAIDLKGLLLEMCATPITNLTDEKPEKEIIDLKVEPISDDKQEQK